MFTLENQNVLIVEKDDLIFPYREREIDINEIKKKSNSYLRFNVLEKMMESDIVIFCTENDSVILKSRQF